MFNERGSVLGKYRLIAEIAHGGMGIVYLAMVAGPGGFHKLVVVKELKPELIDEPTFLTMFLDEARLAARLSHPNIVQTNEVGSEGERYFLAMEYLDGRGLDHVRRRAKTAGFGLSPVMNLRIIADLLAGLDHAHKLADFDGTPLNIVHRDVSPQNVFVTFSGHVKLLDFGIAKAASSSYETSVGILKGKVSYMSPEQARGLKVDARADVFAAGVMLWEVLTGRRFRGGKNEQESLWALVAADLPRASSVKPSVPPELDAICARAMAWDREERYQSAGAFQHDLEAYLASHGPSVTSRDIGECISQLFHEDRARTTALIEAHVARVRAGTARDVPVIDVGSRPTGTTPPGRPETSGPFPGDLGDAAHEPSASANLAAAAQSSPSREMVGRSRRRRLFMVASATAFVTVAAVAAVALWPRSEPPAMAGNLEPAAKAIAAPTPPPEPPRPAAAAPPPVEPHTVAPIKPSLINVEIRVSPSTAKLEIDDAELTSNPFAGNYTRDNSLHRVRVSAPGYITKMVAISFDANVKLDLSLERVPQQEQQTYSRPQRSAPPRSAPAPQPPPAPAPAPTQSPDQTPADKASVPREVDPAGGNRPHRPIDPSNPYGQRS